MVTGPSKKNLPKRLGQQVCAMPYAVCAKSTRTSSRSCSQNYDFENLSPAKLRGYAALHNLEIPEPYSKRSQLAIIRRYKKAEASRRR